MADPSAVLRRCRHAWLVWAATSLVAFIYLELRAYYSECHRTLSRVLQDLTGVRPEKPYGKVAPLIFALFGGWLTWHVLTLEEEQKRCSRSSSG